MKLTTEILEGPEIDQSDFPYGPYGNDLHDAMDDMLTDGIGVCGAGCDAAVAECGASQG